MSVASDNVARMPHSIVSLGHAKYDTSGETFPFKRGRCGANDMEGLTGGAMLGAEPELLFRDYIA